MKARAARRTDESDLRRLLTHRGISTAEEVAEIIARVFPGEDLGPRQARWVEEVVRPANGDGNGSS